MKNGAFIDQLNYFSMKLFTLTVLFFLTASTTFSQESEKVISGSSLKQIEKPKSELKTTHKDQELTPVDKSAEKQQYPLQLSVGERETSPVVKEPTNEDRLHEIEMIDQKINAINGKVEYVKSDQNEREAAEKSGWFTQMEKNKQELIERKSELQKVLND